ncbi:ATP-NAD kinase family protein [Microbacterium sp. USHLN186]|uniref:ATP-NAD kinase family protein n=1 Tax=Microbacterium sp. USHLN186 TaxID=3081286 RepID=UPI0030181898
MIGLVVNPVAGVGGPAGLAGSDGADVQRLAVSRGAHSRAQERATVALRVLAARHPALVIATVAGAMGADAVRAAGLEAWVVYDPASASQSPTTASDTSAAVAALAAAGATLILVAGGDGTLRDAAAGLAGAAPQPAVLGIPSGVKMYSPVFAVSPRAAGSLAADWVDGDLPTTEREVLDIDEAAMRRARVDPQLFGMLRVPFRVGRTQARKAATPASEAAAVAAAARGAVSRMRPGVRYLLGPGGTTAEIARQLGIAKSPLGVDVILDGRQLLRSASEEQLLEEIARGPAQAVVTVIGGQGFLLGRGNQQLSAAVINALGDDPLLVVAPEQKIIDLQGRPLIVETGDPVVDQKLSGHISIITGAVTTSLYAVAAPDLVT